MEDFDPANWRDCPNRTYQRAHRTFGSNIPYYAQGAVFPGDEAGHYCRLSGEKCEAKPSLGECPLLDEVQPCS